LTFSLVIIAQYYARAVQDEREMYPVW